MLERLPPPPIPEPTSRRPPTPWPATPAPSVARHTSELAADAQTVVRRIPAWQKILATLGNSDKTADEIELMTKLPGNTIRPRLIELELAGLTEWNPLYVRETRSGRLAYVHRITEKGRAMMQRPANERRMER